MKVQPLVAALKAAIESGDTAGVPFGDGKKPDTSSTRYVVAFFDGGRVEDRTLRSRDGWSTVMTAHCYGPSPDGARYAYEHLQWSVLGLRGQVIAGRPLLMPEQLTALPLQRDDSTDKPLFDQISEWRFRTA